MKYSLLLIKNNIKNKICIKNHINIISNLKRNICNFLIQLIYTINSNIKLSIFFC